MSVTLVLGGARSGKSRFGESLAHGRRHYIATAQVLDEEMRARVETHQAHRGSGWTAHEENIEIAALLTSLNNHGNFILLDCLTIWLSNLMLGGRDWQVESNRLGEVLRNFRADLVLVSNEVGSGIVPDAAIVRQFRDAQGLLNQQVAALADHVVLVVSGLPLALKGPLPRPATRPA